MAQSLEDVSWTEVQATAHVLDWEINERRPANIQEPETQALIKAGLLVIVDEETRALLPVPAKNPGGKGCGCSK